MSFPVYPRRPHASGQARIKIQGKTHYLGKFGSIESIREHQRLMLLHTQGQPVYSPKDGCTINELCVRFLAHAREKKSTHEYEHYVRVLKCLARLFGPEPTLEFSCGKLESVQSALASGSWLTNAERARSRVEGKWCRTQVNAGISRIRHAWRWAELKGLAPHGSWEHLRALPPVSPADRGVRRTRAREGCTQAQLTAILPHLPAMVQAIAELQWWTGMRPSEVVKMRTRDLRKGEDGTRLYRLSQHKNSWRPGREKEDVLIGPEAWRVLKPWYRAAKLRGGGHLFVSGTQGKCYTVDGYSRALSRAFKRHPELTRFTPYQLRHGAKRRITRDSGLDAARAVLRQQSIQTTDRYDAARDLEIAKEAAKRTG